jgi:hypothetical protein
MGEFPARRIYRPSFKFGTNYGSGDVDLFLIGKLALVIMATVPRRTYSNHCTRVCSMSGTARSAVTFLGDGLCDQTRGVVSMSNPEPTEEQWREIAQQGTREKDSESLADLAHQVVEKRSDGKCPTSDRSAGSAL